MKLALSIDRRGINVNTAARNVWERAGPSALVRIGRPFLFPRSTKAISRESILLFSAERRLNSFSLRTMGLGCQSFPTPQIAIREFLELREADEQHDDCAAVDHSIAPIAQQQARNNKTVQIAPVPQIKSHQTSILASSRSPVSPRR